MELPGRGTTFVRHAPGPAGACAVALLHGFGVTADLNWFTTYAPLSARYEVFALDHRGHGRGIDPGWRPRLEDCADDVVAVADQLGIDRFVAVGYSMGGSIAQLLWRRHRSRVAGLVLCSTSRNFRGRPEERVGFTLFPGLAVALRAAPARVRRRMARQLLNVGPQRSPLAPWAMSELGRNDPVELLEAGHAFGMFSSHAWVGDIDVPVSVVVTTDDRAVPAHRQRKLAAAIPGATVHEIEAGHGAPFQSDGAFLPALLEALGSVVARDRGDGPPAPPGRG
jgi:pimeloyl-ACP methyl ester carboxylesterase